MRVYTSDEEDRIRLQARVHEWTTARLLDARQAAAIDETLRTALKRTKPLLRAALAGFTVLVAAAAIGLVFLTFEIRGTAASATVLALSAAACFAGADYLARGVRLYRYGVEEALAVLSAILLAVATVLVAQAAGFSRGNMDTIAALVVAAAAAWGVYRRFGFVYAGVGALACIGLVPTQFHLPLSGERICAAAVFGAVFFVARAAHRTRGDDFRRHEYNVFEAAACAAAYLSLNLYAWNAVGGWVSRVPTGAIDAWFYWGTYAATWLIPAAALADAIRAKDRPLLTVGIAAALVTLASNKPYLGAPRQTWDPMLFGMLLVAVALGVRRWLSTGRGGARGGYTPERIFQGDHDLLEAVANTSVAWHGRVHAALPADATTSGFDGGRSGGGGGGASY